MATVSQISSPIPVSTQIKQNWDRFHADPDTKAGISKLDKKKFQAEMFMCREHVTTWINFHNYKNSLQQLKAQQGTLSPATESTFATRFADGVAAYQNFVSSAKNLNDMLAQSGFDKPFEQNAKTLCWQLPLNPIYPQLTNMCKNMGLSDSDISEYAASLKANDWDILRLHGLDGTFAGLVKSASQQIPVLQGMVSAVKLHGIPVIEGSGGSFWAWAPVAFMVAAVIIYG